MNLTAQLALYCSPGRALDPIQEMAQVAAQKRFLHKSVALRNGGPVVCGPTPWDGYRGDLAYRIGRPDIEGLEWWMGENGFDAQAYGPASKWRFFKELAAIYEREAQEIREIIAETWAEMQLQAMN